MLFPPLHKSVAVAVLIAATSLSIAAQEPTATPAPTAAAQAAYPDSADGLKLLLQDVFAAMKSKDGQKTSSCFSAMIVPDHDAWFAKMFGPAEGPRMGAKYAQLLPGMPAKLKSSFEYAMKDDRTNVKVSVVQKSGTGSGLGRAIIEAMTTPVPLYVANGTSPKQQFGASIGDFIYIDGGFRYLDTQVFQALSTAPPMRIRTGGNFQKDKLTHKVDPIYPATQAHGIVRLHLILAIDGSVSELTIVQGDPVLAKAAAEAVSQWRYQPTLLNGQPVEVDTTVDVEFRR